MYVNITACTIAFFLLVLVVAVDKENVVSDTDEESIRVLRSTHRVKRVIGGTDVKSGQFPWLAHLHGKIPKKVGWWGIPLVWFGYDHFYCGASILSDRWIMTAAHCIAQPGIDRSKYEKGKYWHVTVGDVDTGRAWWDWVWRIFYSRLEYHADDVFVHENFDRSRLWHNDIALLKLRKTLLYSEYVGSISLPFGVVGENWPAPGSTVTMKGWGCSEEGGPLQDVAQAVNLTMMDRDSCSQYYAYKYQSTADGRLCAGTDNILQSAGICSGDSGGPLVGKLDGLWVQAGIASFTAVGTGGTAPAGFTRVSTMYDWITTTIRNNS